MAAGGMRATGSWGSLSERVRPSEPTAPEPPDSMQHCWVNGEHGRLPGLLLSWQRRPESGWMGRVVRTVVVDGEWVIIEEWLPAAMLEPAKSTAGRDSVGSPRSRNPWRDDWFTHTFHARPPGHATVAAMQLGTWNLENLFRPGGDGPSGQDEYEAKLDGLAATITDLEPEMLAVQEVGDPDALDDLVSRLDGTWHTALADPDRRGIRVGYLSRLELTNIEQVAELPTELGGVQVDDDGERLEQMGRPALRARVHAGGTPIDVITTHLKSKLLTFPGGRFSPTDEGERARYAVYALHRRAAEAAAVRAGADTLLEGDGKNRAVVVAGDLNDTVQAATTQILLGPGGSEIGTPGHERPDKGDPERLFNVAPLIAEDQRYSRIYRGRRELIDHLLVSHALLDAVTEATTGGDATPSITDNPSERRDAPSSDHRPVIMSLDL